MMFKEKSGQSHSKINGLEILNVGTNFCANPDFKISPGTMPARGFIVTHSTSHQAYAPNLIV